MLMFGVAYQGLTGTLEHVAHILTGTRLYWVPTDESKVVGLLDTLQQMQHKQEIRMKQGKGFLLIFLISTAT